PRSRPALEAAPGALERVARGREEPVGERIAAGDGAGRRVEHVCARRAAAVVFFVQPLEGLRVDRRPAARQPAAQAPTLLEILGQDRAIRAQRATGPDPADRAPLTAGAQITDVGIERVLLTFRNRR